MVISNACFTNLQGDMLVVQELKKSQWVFIKQRFRAVFFLTYLLITGTFVSVTFSQRGEKVPNACRSDIGVNKVTEERSCLSVISKQS
jgi:hypothetical protein